MIEGNYIGVDSSGGTALPNNGPGIYAVLTAAGNTIGGTTAGDGNVISGNHGSGISLSDTGAFLIAGNKIGTDASGAVGPAQPGRRHPRRRGHRRHHRRHHRRPPATSSRATR